MFYLSKKYLENKYPGLLFYQLLVAFVKFSCFFLFGALFVLILSNDLTAQQNDIVGYWKSCDEGDNMVVRIDLVDGIPEGYLVGFQRNDGSWEDNKPKKGVKVMYGFKYKGDLKWNGGKIFDPIADRAYRGVVKIQSKDTIKATGYWGFLWDDILYKRIGLEKKDEPKG